MMTVSVQRTRAVVAIVCVLASGSAVQAIVSTIDATVTAQVQEFEGAGVANSDFAFKDLNETATNLPLVATAVLKRAGSGGDIDAAAVAQTTFSDPRLSVLPDPNEFGIDLGAYSLSPVISYSGECASNETREITFLSSEIGFPDGTPLEAESQFFVDGVILIWGDVGQTNLAGTTAEMTLSVDQIRSNGSATVLSAGLTLTGQADGSVSLSTQDELTADNVIVANLTGVVSKLGPVHLVIIPNTALTYPYSADVGEAFQLQANINGNIRTQPRTGAAIVLGVPLTKVAELVNEVTGEDVGNQLQQALQLLLITSPLPLKPLAPKAEPTTVRVVDRLASPSCGRMGIESALLMAGLALRVGLSSSRKIRRFSRPVR